MDAEAAEPEIFVVSWSEFQSGTPYRSSCSLTCRWSPALVCLFDAWIAREGLIPVIRENQRWSDPHLLGALGCQVDDEEL